MNILKLDEKMSGEGSEPGMTLFMISGCITQASGTVSAMVWGDNDLEAQKNFAGHLLDIYPDVVEECKAQKEKPMIEIFGVTPIGMAYEQPWITLQGVGCFLGIIVVLYCLRSVGAL